jgi:hypothetical protein
VNKEEKIRAQGLDLEGDRLLANARSPLLSQHWRVDRLLAWKRL